MRKDLLAFIIRTFATLDDFEKFRPNWHIELIADRLQQTFERKIKRLVINVPPRSLKSICGSVAFPAWALGQDPKLKFICTSHGQDLTGKHARDFRTVMEASWYQRLFPHSQLKADKRAEEEFVTRAGGGRYSTSIGGPLTGRGGNFIIIDDPIKSQDVHSSVRRASNNGWIDETALSRLNDKKSDVIILIMQRVHVDDMTAYVMEKGGWEVLRLPAIAERDESFRLSNGQSVGRKAGEALQADHEPLHVLADARRQMGEMAFSAQFQQAPVPLEGNLLKADWFERYDRQPDIGTSDQVVQSWDVATTSNGNSDWSVCTTWLIKNKKYYLLHVSRERLTFPALKRKILRLAEYHQAKTVLIEDAGIATTMVQLLKSEGVRVIGCRPEGCKITRMEGQSVLIESGRVLIPKTAPWLAAYLAELLSFPAGRHDDQVDSTSQFLVWANRPRRRAGVLW